MSTEHQALSHEELEEQLATELPHREAMTLIGSFGSTNFIGMAPDATPLPPGEALPDSEPLPPGEALPDSEPIPPGEALPDSELK